MVRDAMSFQVSQSKVKVWRRCQYAYHLRYVEKLRKKTKSRPLTFGTIVHSMIEKYAEGDDPFDALEEAAEKNKKLFRTEQEIYGEIIDDVRQIMTSYFEYYPEEELVYKRIKGRNGEHEFNITMDDYDLPEVTWTGKIDAIGRTPNKALWIVEHKTFSKKPSDDDRWRNLQSATYIKVNQTLGWKPVEGMLWDYIGSKSPTKPGLLKDGSLSQKNISTLPITVKETIAELGLKSMDVVELLKKSESHLADWFQRIHTPVNEEVVDMLFDDFVVSIKEMMRGHGKCKVKNIEKHCGWCDYNNICRAELEGSDRDFVIQKEYTIAKREEYEPALAHSAE